MVIDMEIMKRNNDFAHLIESSDILFFGDSGFDTALRDVLKKFLDKWNENPLWNFSYSSKALGLQTYGDTIEELEIWGMGCHVNIVRFNNDKIRWTYRLYDSRGLHADGEMEPGELAVTDKKVLVERIIGIFETMLTLFDLESDLNEQVRSADYKARGIEI